MNKEIITEDGIEVVESKTETNLMDLNIENQSMPAIQTNYEQVKQNLEVKLKEYKNLAVTEETLKERKADQSFLTSMRRSIDEKRKEKKKELSAPIVEFDQQCKELIDLITKAEVPLKDGIKVYDDKKREEKRIFAKEYFDKCIEGKNIETKFIIFETPKSCEVLNSTKKAIRKEVEDMVAAIELKQEIERNTLQSIEAAIEAQNSRLQTKISIDSFRFFIDANISLEEILKEIQKRGDELFTAEQMSIAAVQQQVTYEELDFGVSDNNVNVIQNYEETVPESTQQFVENENSLQDSCVFMNIPTEAPAASQEVVSDLYEVVFKVTGDFATIKNLSDYIIENNIEKEIISQIKK